MGPQFSKIRLALLPGKPEWSGTASSRISTATSFVALGFLATGCTTSGFAQGDGENAIFSKNSFVLSNIAKDFRTTHSIADEVGDADIESSQDSPAAKSQPTLTGPYARISEAAKSKSTGSSRLLVTSTQNRFDAQRQKLLPQVTPGASLDEEGKLVGELRVQQVLFDSGRYRAEKAILGGEHDEERYNLAVKEQEQANGAIASYVAYHHSREAAGVTRDIIATYREFEKQAKARLRSGVGASSDLDLFSLKKLEAQSELANHTNEANEERQKFKALTGLDMPKKKPAAMNARDIASLSPKIPQAIAKRDQALGKLKLERANRKPNISLVGNVGMNTDGFAQDRPDLRVQVTMNKPLTWGVDHDLAAERNRLDAEKLKVDETIQEIRDNLAVERLKASQNRKKLKSLSKLLKTAKGRLHGFNQQFLAGKASIRDAVSIVDAYKRIRLNLVDTKYAVRRAELEIAYLSGGL